MPLESKAEALAFVEAMRLAVKGKQGFAWLTGELDDLYRFIELRTLDEREDTRSE